MAEIPKHNHRFGCIKNPKKTMGFFTPQTSTRCFLRLATFTIKKTNAVTSSVANTVPWGHAENKKPETVFFKRKKPGVFWLTSFFLDVTCI